MVQAPAAEVESPPVEGGEDVSLDAEISRFEATGDMVAFYRDNYTLERLEGLLEYLTNGGVRDYLSSQLQEVERDIAAWRESAIYHRDGDKVTLEGGLAKADKMRVLVNEKEKLESRLKAVEKAYDETAGYVRSAIKDKELVGLPRAIFVRSRPSDNIVPVDYTHDEEGILLEPDLEKGELAVLNPAVYQHNEDGPWPFPYRVVMEDDAGDYSEIHFRLLKPPTKLSKKSRPLIVREYGWECRGCEDPRLTKVGDTYFITYTAYDGVNARIALAVTRDFVHVKKLGPIGPEIRLEEAVELVPDERYRKVWSEGLSKSRGNDGDIKAPGTYEINGRGRKVPILLDDKDAAVSYEDGWWVLKHRLDPDMHVARARKLEHFKNIEFWRDYIRNIVKYEFIEGQEPWCRKKVGWGDAGTTVHNGKRIGLYHGVNDDLWYSGSFYERHPEDPTKAVAIMRDPLFVPDGEMYKYEHPNAEGKPEVKMVAFPTGIVIQGRVLWTYMGIADTKIGYRSTDVSWVEQELEHNRCA